MLDLGDSDIDIITVDDVGLNALVELNQLKVLSLQRCRWIGDAACMTLAQISTLQALDLSHTDISARGLVWLSQLPHLHSLNLADCR